VSVLVDLKTGDPEDAGAQFQTAGYQLAYEANGGDLVTFEPAGHVYRVGGEIVPGVTTILRDTGVSVNFEELGTFGKRIEHAIQLKRDIGLAVHADAHAFDDHDIDMATVNEEAKPYLDCWIAFRQNYPNLRPATRERLVYHPTLRYAGTLDGIFLIGGETEITITERWSVQLCPGKRVPYRVTPYEDHYGDADAFKAFVSTWWRQAARRAA
jgi:hypothetical protein